MSLKINFFLDTDGYFDINKFMFYEYECECCNERFELNLSMADRDKPTEEPGPCGKGGKVNRVFMQSGAHQTNMVNTKEKKAGGQWTSTLERIHKTAGSESTLGKYI